MEGVEPLLGVTLARPRLIAFSRRILALEAGLRVGDEAAEGSAEGRSQGSAAGYRKQSFTTDGKTNAGSVQSSRLGERLEGHALLSAKFLHALRD